MSKTPLPLSRRVISRATDYSPFIVNY